MLHSRFVVLYVISVLFLVEALGTLANEEAALNTKPTSMAFFPGSVVGIQRQIDGSTICATTEGVFLAVDNLYRWSAVSSLSREHVFRPVGGDRDRFFVEDLIGNADRQFGTNSNLIVFGDDYSLQAVEVNRKATVVRQNIPQGSLAAFASKNVGAITTGRTKNGTALVLTTDGGVIWNSIPPVLWGEQEEDISTLCWVNLSRLLVGGTRGLVRLYEHNGHGVLRQVWVAKVPEPVRNLSVDGDYVWLGQESLYHLKLADGKLDATVKPGVPVLGMAACHGSLLIWDTGNTDGRPRVHHGLDGFKTEKEFLANEAKVAAKDSPHIHVWERDPKAGYRSRAKISATRIAGILPLESPMCLVVLADGGRGLLLDLDRAKLSNTSLQVTPLPPLPVDPNVATSDQIKAMLDLAARLPMHDRDAIFKESMNKRKESHLTPRQLNEWLTEQFRHYIETKKPGPVNLAAELTEHEKNRVTLQQMQTAWELYSQIPREKANAITAESAKKGLTGRQRYEWMIEQYRQYLEHHKPKVEEEKLPDEEIGGSNRNNKPARSSE